MKPEGTVHILLLLCRGCISLDLYLAKPEVKKALIFFFFVFDFVFFCSDEKQGAAAAAVADLPMVVDDGRVESRGDDDDAAGNGGDDVRDDAMPQLEELSLEAKMSAAGSRPGRIKKKKRSVRYGFGGKIISGFTPNPYLGARHLLCVFSRLQVVVIMHSLV